MDETDRQPAGDQRPLPFGDHAEERQIGIIRVRRFRVMARDGVVGEKAYGLGVFAGGEILECAHADMAGGDAGDDAAGEHGFAHHILPGRDGGQRPCSGEAERRHGLADEVFP